MEPNTPVVSSPIFIARLNNPYEGRYSEEHLDDCREQYSEVFTEQPPPLYLNLLDSVEDLQISTYQTNIIYKEKTSTTPLQEKVGCCSLFGSFIDWICDVFCCCC
jgi:hypothetical protein